MVTDDDALAGARRNFARQMLALSGALDDKRLEDAFAAVARERFLGDSAWRIMFAPPHYQDLADKDPVLIYQDVVVGLQPERGVNTGSPSMHARFLHALAPRLGEHVVHIGAGAGYYSAILAHLVGSGGRVTAVEFNADLAQRAAVNLAALSHVTAVRGDGAEWPADAVDCIYVNFAVSRPAERWLQALKPGARLIFPLGPPEMPASGRGGRHALRGIAVMVTRLEHGFAARVLLSQVAFVSAEGVLAGREDEQDALRQSLERGDAERIRSLIWRQDIDASRCWYAAEDWALAYDDVRN